MTTTMSKRSATVNVHPLDIPRLEKAKAFIEANFHNNPKLDAIAAQASFSQFHFHRLFTKHFGTTPQRLTTTLQIEAAKTKLLAGIPQPEVVLSLGFAHQSHFCARFKQIVGMAPGRWLRDQRNDDGSK